MSDCVLQPPIQSGARNGKRKRSRGQSMVEFALVLPLLLGFLLIAGDFGRALTAYMTVSSSAREGASYGSRSTETAADTSAIVNAALNEVGADRTIWGTTPSVTVATGIDTQGYDWVAVTVSYTFTPMVSVWPVNDPVPMNRTVRMRVLGS